MKYVFSRLIITFHPVAKRWALGSFPLYMYLSLLIPLRIQVLTENIKKKKIKRAGVERLIFFLVKHSTGCASGFTYFQIKGFAK